MSLIEYERKREAGHFCDETQKNNVGNLSLFDDYHTKFGRFCIECTNISNCFKTALSCNKSN